MRTLINTRSDDLYVLKCMKNSYKEFFYQLL